MNSSRQLTFTWTILNKTYFSDVWLKNHFSQRLLLPINHARISHIVNFKTSRNTIRNSKTNPTLFLMKLWFACKKAVSPKRCSPVLVLTVSTDPKWIKTFLPFSIMSNMIKIQPQKASKIDRNNSFVKLKLTTSSYLFIYVHSSYNRISFLIISNKNIQNGMCISQVSSHRD